MSRKLRVEYQGAIYHVMNRGYHREDIFRNDEDQKLFLQTLAEACTKTDWHIHAWCLMSNHFHLVVDAFLWSSFPEYLKSPGGRPHGASLQY